jgi:hypothetical protein
LLVQRSPNGGTHLLSRLVQNRERKFLGPKRFTGATETLISFGDRWQAKHVPILTSVRE